MQTRPLSSLHEWDKNPRSISQAGFDRLKKQITQLGQYKPLIITPEGEILGGNMRYKAYKDLGIKDVWVSIVTPKDENEKLAYALSDNDRAGFYDDDLLANLSSDYPDFAWKDFAVDLKEPVLLSDLMNENKEIEEDDAPAVSDEPAISVYGEVYQLGRHRLMCGDATKIEDIEKLMNGQKADMVFTDPPYGMFLDADFSDMKNNLNFAKDKGFVGGKKYDNVIGDHQDFNPDFINTIFAVFPDAKEVFMWGANYYTELLQNRNGGSWFVWDKRLEESADKMYGSCFELCWSKKKHKQDIARVKWAGVFGIEQEFDHKRYHPTQKPVELSAWFIKRFSEEGWNIVDLFGGSGSTLIACEETNRTCYMMELDPKYCDVIRKRYAKIIGKEDEWLKVTPKVSQTPSVLAGRPKSPMTLSRN